MTSDQKGLLSLSDNRNKTQAMRSYCAGICLFCKPHGFYFGPKRVRCHQFILSDFIAAPRTQRGEAAAAAEPFAESVIAIKRK